MWKDFFYYSRSERRSILFLIFLLVLLIGGNVLVNNLKQEEYMLADTDRKNIETFLERLQDEKSGTSRRSRENAEAFQAVLRPFDPNTEDSAGLRSLGMPAFVARNILRYREKGGVFRTPESLARIYGLDKELFRSLKPYIVISEAFRRVRDTARWTPARDTSAWTKYPEGTVVDLNRADTSQLKRVPGIGSGIARLIIAYRERLGGFYAVAQLQEVPHVTPAMHRWFKVENAVLRPVQVNRSGLDKLRSHPYMDFYKAKAILEYRRKRGNIKSLAQLSMLEEFSREDLERLSPYLSFD